METLTMQKIDRENELNLELSKMKEAAEEKDNLVREIDVLKNSHKEEKAQLLKQIDENIRNSEVLRRDLNDSIQNLEKTVDELKKDVEKSKNEISVKEEEFAAKLKILASVEENLKLQLDDSNKRETELQQHLSEVKKLGVENVEQLTKQLNENNVHSKELENRIAELETTSQKKTVEQDELKVKLEVVEREKEELTKTHTKNEEYFTEIKSKLEQQLFEATTQFKSTEDEQVDLVNRNIELKQQIDQANEEILEQNKKKIEADEQLVKVVTEFEALKVSAEKIQNDMHVQVAESLKKETERCEHIKMLESQNEEFKHAIDNKQKQIEKISSSLSATQVEYETLKSEAAAFKESTQAQASLLQHDATEHIKTIKSLEDKIDQLTSSVNLSDDLKNELNHKSEEIKSKETNIAELCSTVNALKELIIVKEADLKKLFEEKEVEEKRSLDVIVSKDEEIKTIQIQFETLRKSLEDKTADLANLSSEKSSISSEKNSLVEEISRLNNQIKEYSENFVDRTELNNLKEEFSIYEETKQNEIANLTTKLHEIEERVKNQSEGVDKLDMLERKQKEIVYEKTALERREAQLVLENKQLADKLLQMKANSTTAIPVQVEDSETGAQISFLNSIIADMQKKNETLTHRIQALESAPSDFVNNGLFDLPVKRQPAPRLFCDICDEFDAHETEDCPLQSSDSPPPINLPVMTSTADLISKDAPKERKIPPPRKYCDTCEVFGHDSTECEIEETF